MKIGALTAAWAGQPLEEVLDFFAGAGLTAVEIGTGNFPPDAHCNPFRLNEDAGARKAFMRAIRSRGMVLSALSCHGNPLHPNAKYAKSNHEVFVATVQLAHKLGVHEVNGFSGLPAGAPGDKTPNWVVAPWPDDHLAALEYQWDQVAIPYWREQNAFLEKHKVNMCFEMHPNFLVYNPESLIKLRKACGKRMCANFDPSHLFWQGIDPVEAIRWIQEHGKVIRHVHAKDSLIQWAVAKIQGVLDTKHYGDELNRAWLFRTIGWGHSEEMWRAIVTILIETGYVGAISIEHEDSLMSNNEGFLQAAVMLKGIVPQQARTKMTWA
jgi:sugar phosphate isomerase/epimerase